MDVGIIAIVAGSSGAALSFIGSALGIVYKIGQQNAKLDHFATHMPDILKKCEQIPVIKSELTDINRRLERIENGINHERAHYHKEEHDG